MKALILAAGMGNRLQEASRQQPKCLLEFAGKTLLERHIENLSSLGLSEIHIVTGFENQLIETHLSDMKINNCLVKTIQNPDFDLGSVISFYSGKTVVQDEQEIILMDADVLYSKDILSRLIKSHLRNVFLLDQDFVPGDEPVKLCVKNQQIIEFRKQIDKNLDFDFQGESVGFFKFSADVFQQLQTIAGNYVQKGDQQQPYEEVIRDLLLEKPDLFQYEDISGLPWIEIDFPEDIEKANTDILPKL